MIREISIRKVNRGIIAVVGCQTFVFEKLSELFTAIEEYYSDPDTAEKKYVDELMQCQGHWHSGHGLASGPIEDKVVGTPRTGMSGTASSLLAMKNNLLRKASEADEK